MKSLRNGFTIIELMITVAVMAILLALAIPDFRRFIQRARIDSEILELQSFLMNARGYAIKTGQDIWVSNGAAGWNGQLTYFADLDTNASLGPLEQARGQYRAPSEIVLAPGAAVATGIGFNSRGELIGGGNLANGSVGIRVPTLIDNPNYFVGVINFNVTGRTTVLKFKQPSSTVAAGVSDGGWN